MQLYSRSEQIPALCDVIFSGPNRGDVCLDGAIEEVDGILQLLSASLVFGTLVLVAKRGGSRVLHALSSTFHPEGHRDTDDDADQGPDRVRRGIPSEVRHHGQDSTAGRVVTWQAFVLAHGARVPVHHLAAIVGQPEEAINGLRNARGCARTPRHTFPELFEPSACGPTTEALVRVHLPGERRRRPPDDLRGVSTLSRRQSRCAIDRDPLFFLRDTSVLFVSRRVTAVAKRFG